MKPNKETYRILVIDDHPIVAEGIIALASQLEGVTCKEPLVQKTWNN